MFTLSIKRTCINSYSIALSIAILHNISFVTAFASESTVVVDSTVCSTTIEILKQEIALERFCLNYEIIGNREPKLRRLRYFLGQQASLGLFLGGDIVALQETGKHLDTPAKISSNHLKSGYTVELIGSIIGGASSLAELCSNGYIALKNKKHKEDPQSALTVVKNKIREIDQLLAKRNELLNREKDSPVYRINTVEGDLLKDYRDWCVYEFVHVYADIKAYQASENVYYTLNTASNAVFSAAAYLAIRSFQNVQLASSSIVTGITGDSISILSAPASYFARKLLYKHYARKIYQTIQQKAYDIETASADNLDLLHKEVVKTTDSDLTGAGHIRLRLTAYDLWNQKYDEYLGAEMDYLRRYDKIALQSVTLGPLISGSYLTQDILGAAAYYGNKNRIRTANNLTFAGAITAGAGSVVGLGATSWYFIDETLTQRKLSRQGKLPEQLLLQRLKTLDQVEMMIGN